ncbi:hypothetical protein [Vagococcus fluvialis]|uniref:hypothetical protein n=1 Tax=Vagococcus fluvialis TaxID=2738 RepID=UPI002B2C92EF|nr:hypothetical protein QDW48_11870 [Vagococcus fluvialis]
MDRIILPFEKEDITIDEMLEHANWYMMKSDEGMNFLKNKDNKSSMAVLREINKCLEQEYKHYDKLVVSNAVRNNAVASTYIDEISSCLVKQNRKTSYNTLSSNLYDVWDYAHSFVNYIEYNNLA